MKTVRIKIDVQSPNAKPIGRINVRRVDATTEADIANHQAEDDANAMLDSAKFARRVRRRLGFSQVEFAERINVSLDTIRPNAKLLALGTHYGFVPRASQPYRAQTKSKVERPYRYIRADFFMARSLTAHKAIPRAIWLACLGWEATRPQSKALPRALPTAREYALAHA